VAALVFGTQSSAQLPTSGVLVRLTFGDKPTLDMKSLSANTGLPVSSISASGTSAAQSVSRVTINFAGGYGASTSAAGSTVGLAVVSTSSGSALSGSLAVIFAELTADDPARYAADPAAQACAPGPYVAVLRLSTSVLGLSYTMPIFVGHPAADSQRIELTFCPPPLAGADGKPVTAAPMPVTGMDLLIGTLTGPTGPGKYTSSAYVTGVGPTGAADPATTAEARFVDPIPHTLTLKGRYDARRRDAVLSGRVVESGRPQAGAIVEYIRTDLFSEPKTVRTSTRGTFTARVRIGSTTTFLADVADATGPCSGPSSAPRGCLSLTVAGTNTRSVRVVVPKRR
jgi:hypothetical protein